MFGCLSPESTLISSCTWSIWAMLRKLLASTDLMATVSPADSQERCLPTSMMQCCTIVSGLPWVTVLTITLWAS